MTHAHMSPSSRGPLRTFDPSCLLGAGGMPACRVPARRPGNFHLVAQMKVTKAKSLNAKPLCSFCTLRNPGPAGHWNERDTSIPQRARSRGASQARPRENAECGADAKRGPLRHCRRDDRPIHPTARRAGRARGEERAERCCIEPLCFGDFHLGPQMKVTRPPGRDPADWQSSKVNEARRHQRPQRAASRSPFNLSRVAGRAKRGGATEVTTVKLVAARHRRPPARRSPHRGGVAPD
jgi:hypothetical protein